LRAEQSEFAVADDGNLIVVVDSYSFEYAAGGGEWLSEDCMFVWDVVGNWQKIDCGELKKLSVCAIAAMDAEYGSCSAVSRITRATEFAFAAARIDLADNALASVFNNTNKLVSDRPIETRVPARDLEIGITDPRQNDTHERLISTLWFLDLCNG